MCVSVAVMLHDYRVNRTTIITEEGRIAHTNLPDYDLAYTLEYNLRKYKELEKMQKMQEYSSDDCQAALEDWIAAAKKERDYADDNLQKLYNS